MRTTPRCWDILRLLAIARWLMTNQIHRRFFAPATMDAGRKRLSKLADAGLIRKVQPNRMEHALFTLGPRGKALVERDGTNEIKLERQIPKQLDHLLGVNDVRIAAELSLPIAFFFAYWELPGISWKQPIIPDAIFGTGGRTVALEFDRGMENVSFFINTKLKWYSRGLDGVAIHRLLIVTDRRQRMESLAKSIHEPCAVFTTLDLVRQYGLTSPIFFDGSQSEGVNLL